MSLTPREEYGRCSRLQWKGRVGKLQFSEQSSIPVLALGRPSFHYCFASNNSSKGTISLARGIEEDTESLLSLLFQKYSAMPVRGHRRKQPGPRQLQAPMYITTSCSQINCQRAIVVLEEFMESSQKHKTLPFELLFAASRAGSMHQVFAFLAVFE